MSSSQTAWFLVDIYFVSIYIIGPIKIDLIGEKNKKFSDLWAVGSTVITGKLEHIYLYQAPIKTPFKTHVITAVFSEVAGDSQDEKGQIKFSSKEKYIPNEQFNQR